MHWFYIWLMLTVGAVLVQTFTRQAWGIAFEQSLLFGFLCIMAAGIVQIFRKGHCRK